MFRVGHVGVAMALALGVAGAAQATPELTRAPELVHYVEPEYPADAIERRLEGAVELTIEIGADGSVDSVTPSPLAEPTLAAAAAAAARSMRFSPAEIDGAPAAIAVLYTFHFRLPETVPHAAPTPPTAEEPQVADPLLGSPAEEPPTSYETIVRVAPPPPRTTERRLSSEQLRTVPGAFGDPIRVIETLPGIGRSPFSSGILVMRGSSPDDSGVYLDGHQVPLLYHFGGGPSVIPPDAIDSLSVAPGGFGARYGRATGGIVEVHSRPGRADAFHGQAGVDLLNAGGAIEGPIADRGSFRLSGRRSYVDALIPLIAGGPGERADVTLAPRYYDYHCRADLTAASGLDLGLVASGSDDELVFTSNLAVEDLPPAFALQMSSHRLNPRLAAELGHGFSFHLSPAIAWLSTRGETAYQFLDLATRQTSLRADLVQERGDDRVTVGVDLVRNDHAFTARVPAMGARDFPSADPREPPAHDVRGELRVVQTGMFGDVTLGLGRLRVTPGLRLEHVNLLSRAETRVDPRLDLRLRLGGGVVAKMMGGIYHQLPRPEELAPDTGNPELSLERSVQGAAGFEWTFLNAFRADVSTYYKAMRDLAQPTRDYQVDNGRLRYLRYRSSGEGRAAGAELMLQRTVEHGVTGWVAYSISRSERRGKGGVWRLYARDQTHNVSAVLAVDLPSDVRVSARYRYVTGYPQAQIDGAEFDADAARYVPEVSGDVARVPAFMQLDLRAEKMFGERGDTHIVAYLDVQNVTNRRNAEYFQWSYDYSERYEYPGLPILPTLGLEAAF